jgi:sulfur carrier protein
MNISINGEKHVVAPGHALGQTLQLLGITVERGVAVAVNDRVVRRDALATYELQPDDRILLITATQGG